MDGSTTQQHSRKRRRPPSSSTMKPLQTLLTTISTITFLSSTFNQSYYCNSVVVYAQSATTTGLRRPHHTTDNILDVLSKRDPQHGLHSPRLPSQDYYVSNTNKLTSNRRLINSPTYDRHRQQSSDDTITSLSTTSVTKVEQRRAATWGEKGRDISISHKEENIKRKKLNKLQAQKIKLQELRGRNNKKNKKKSKPGGRGSSNNKPGRGNGGGNKKKSKPGRGKKNNGDGRSKKKSGRPNNNNGRSKKKPNKKKPNKKKPGRSTNKKPKKPKKPNGGGKNKPGNNDKPKPAQGQQQQESGGKHNGNGKEDKPDKLQSTLNGSGGKDKPNKPGNPNRPNNKPDKDEPSYTAVKPNNKPDVDSIKPQSKPQQQQQSSYQVIKPSKDKPKPNSNNNPNNADDVDSIKPMKPQSNLQIALAYFNITKQDYKQLNDKQKEGILAMTDGQINFDEQQQDGYLSIGDSVSGSDSGVDGQFNFGNIPSNSQTTDMMEEQTTIQKSLKWNFVNDELTDYSTLLDSFEYTSNLNWDYGDWKVIDSNIAYTKYDNGSKSLMSGINSQTYTTETNGQSIYSNITLTTDSNFDGGVITFKIQSKTLILPNEALFVEVDDIVSLAPDVISMGGSSINPKTNDDWKEYSIPVGNGKHTVKWVHVYNPFQLKSLPSPQDEIGLYMDDVRYVPYTLQEHNNAWTNGMVEMKRGGYVIASDSGEEEVESDSNNDDEQHWKISNDGDTVKATSSSIQEDSSSSSGYSYIQFELYSSNGGLLTYRIKSSTSAPHDDFAISINNINVESIFGNMLGYESHSLSIPRGKALITLKHRVNPGRLSDGVLRSLGSGNGGSDDETLLKDLNFSW